MGVVTDQSEAVHAKSTETKLQNNTGRANGSRTHVVPQDPQYNDVPSFERGQARSITIVGQTATSTTYDRDKTLNSIYVLTSFHSDVKINYFQPCITREAARYITRYTNKKAKPCMPS